MYSMVPRVKITVCILEFCRVDFKNFHTQKKIEKKNNKVTVR